MHKYGNLCKCVFTLSDGQAPQPWVFLLGHQKEHEKETLGGRRLQTRWKRPSVSHSWVCPNYKRWRRQEKPHRQRETIQLGQYSEVTPIMFSFVDILFNFFEILRNTLFCLIRDQKSNSVSHLRIKYEAIAG